MGEADTPGDDGPVTVEHARELLEAHVATTRWGRRGLAARLEIEAFEPHGAQHVRLDTHFETRVVESAEKPYDGGEVDGPDRGRPPDAWDVKAPDVPAFGEDRWGRALPHTERVARCETCDGAGKVTCDSCDGEGERSCWRCGGDGRVRGSKGSSMCLFCLGTGRNTCSTCSASGRLECERCRGFGELLHFRRLSVEWTVEVAERVLEVTDLPDDLLPASDGRVVVSEEAPRLLEPPKGGHGYRGSSRLSRDALEAAADLLVTPTEASERRILRQRLVVRVMPVYEARYRWGRETRKFWIYGLDDRVHAPEFPISPLRVAGAVVGGAAALAGIALAWYALARP